MFTSYDYFIYFIIFIKILFFISIFALVNYKHKMKYNEELYEKKTKIARFFKIRLEFIFIASVSILLIVVFNPFRKNKIVIHENTKLLLFLFGILILINEDWKMIAKTLPAYKELFSK